MAAENPSVSEASLPEPDPKLDHFARLGLPRRHDLERAAIETAYLELSRRFHPDRFADAQPRERWRAQEHASRINEAYRTVRDPVARAEYLVWLSGRDLDSNDPEHGAPRPDQSFLVDMLERREHLQTAAAAGAAGLEKLLERVEREVEERLDAAVQALAAGDVACAADELMRRRYLQRYLDEIVVAQGGDR